MITINRITKNDVLSSLPDLVSFSSNQMVAQSPVALLICTAGFEDRATAVVKAVSCCDIEGLLVLRYPTNLVENARSLEMLRGITARRAMELTYDRAEFRRSLRAALDELLAEEHTPVVVDISVMSSYLLYRVLDALLEHRLSPRVSVFYSEAGEYYPHQAEWERVHMRARKAKDFLKKANLYEKSGFQSLGVDAIYKNHFRARTFLRCPLRWSPFRTLAALACGRCWHTPKATTTRRWRKPFG